MVTVPFFRWPVVYLNQKIKTHGYGFLSYFKKAIDTPNGLVISSDMQKGLEIAITQVYPTVEHRECIRHLYSNFKKHFRGDFFTRTLWRVARTFNVTKYERCLTEIGEVNKDALAYINENHNKIWCRSKFGTTSKCDYITNNISEAFNAWIGELRYKPVLDLLDSMREKIMSLGEYEICRSSENRAEVKRGEKRWEVELDEQTCTCRVWQVKGIPCLHAAAFIAFTRDVNWEKFVDSYFAIEKFKSAYALEVAPMPTKDQWVYIDAEEKIYPPIIKRRPGGQEE